MSYERTFLFSVSLSSDSEKLVEASEDVSQTLPPSRSRSARPSFLTREGFTFFSFYGTNVLSRSIAKKPPV